MWFFRPKTRQMYGLCRNQCDSGNICHTDFPEALSIDAPRARYAFPAVPRKTRRNIKLMVSANLRDDSQTD